jgi:uncharacterized UPF0160 family protein
MERIKLFNENWMDVITNKASDIFNPKKAYINKAKNYLDSFKKTYQERNKTENILVECLYKLEVTETQNARYLGAAEVVLIMDGFLDKQGKPFNYKEKEEKFLFMTFKTKESYREHIIRLTKEYLTEKGVL